MEKLQRPVRVLVAKVGLDGHDRGAKVIGFDVDVGPLFAMPEEVARQAVKNDVHIVGVSSLAGGHRIWLPELREELTRQGMPGVILVAGGVIPGEDYDWLKERGVDFVFGPGTNLSKAASEMLQQLLLK